MLDTIEKEISELYRIITLRYPEARIILFGSYARGNAYYDSDIDICVVLEIFNKRRIDICREIRKDCIGKIHKPLDILVFNKTDFEENSKHPSNLEYVIAREGVNVNGAS